VKISNACSENVTVPRDAGCCAFAGDRGFLFEELTASAARTEAQQATAEAMTLLLVQPHLRDRHDPRHGQGLPILFAPA